MSEMSERVERIRETYRSSGDITMIDIFWLMQKTEYADRLDKATDDLVKWYNEEVAKKTAMITELTKKLADKEKNSG